MVAKITFPDSLTDALNYHEQKVQHGQARCLLAQNFLKEKDHLTFHDKKRRFERLMQLNTRAVKKLVHISLNFHPSEKPSPGQLREIADLYMNQLGYSQQPYLVYLHRDAGHPHIHILTTNIQPDGKRMSTHFMGKRLSEPARKLIEEKFNLVRTAGNTPGNDLPTGAQLVYGKTPTKRAIVNVLDEVIPHYRYCSLEQLNAILNRRNVLADRGKENSNTFKKGGLVYRALDDKGAPTGVPIKASSIYNKPTLSYLQKRMAENSEAKAPHKPAVRQRVDHALQNAGSLDEFIHRLKTKKIDSVLHRNDTGYIYGITFVDHQTKTVFKGSDLGKPYTAAAILKAVQSPPQSAGIAPPAQQPGHPPATEKPTTTTAADIPVPGKQKELTVPPPAKNAPPPHRPSALEQLPKTERDFSNVPFELRKRKKKKRKRKPGL